MYLKLYIHKSFWNQYAYFDTQNRENIYWKNFKQWILQFLSEYELILECELGEMANILAENEFINALYDQKTPLRTIYKVDFSSHLEDNAFYETDIYPFRIFLTHENDFSKTEKLSNKFGFLYLNITNLPAQWETFYSLRSDAKMIVTKSPNQPNKFDSWDKLQAFQHPLNSILIFDNYILCEDKNKNKKFTSNIFPLLENILCNNNRVESVIEVIILAEYAKFHRIDSDGIPQKRNQIANIHEDIKFFLEDKFRDLRFQIRLVGYQVDKHKTIFETNPDAAKIHDRYLITNYFCIESPGGFDLFDTSNSITKTTKITFDFIFHSL